ncbi:15045_t:CDS:1, partial [Racocetra persica]
TELDKKYKDLIEVLSRYYKEKIFLVYAELIKHHSIQENLYDEYKCVIDAELKKNIAMDHISQ